MRKPHFFSCGHHWTVQTQQKISWSLHESIVKSQQSTSYTKFLHRCLPVQHTLHRRNQATTPICCRCNQQDETDEHVITCPASDDWRDDLLDWYRSQIQEQEIDPTLIEIIITALKLHAKGMTLRASRYPQKYQNAINDMNEIGWGQWYQSRVAISLCVLFPQKKKKGSSIKILLAHTTTQWKRLWKQRNEIVHGSEKQKQQIKKRDRVDAEITYIYSRRHLYMLRDREILLPSLREHLEQALFSKQNWLLLYKKHLQESAKTFRTITTKGTRKISEYFNKK